MRVGDAGAAVTVDNDRLEIFAPHDCAEATAANRISLTHDDIGKENAFLAGWANRRHAATFCQRCDRGLDPLSPQVCSIENLDPLRRDRQDRRPGCASGKEQGVNAGTFQPPGEAAAGRAVVDRSGQR